MQTKTDVFVFASLFFGSILIGCNKTEYQTRDHQVVAENTVKNGGDVPLALKGVDCELSFQKGDYDNAFKLLTEILKSSNVDARNVMLSSGNYCKTDDSKAKMLEIIESSRKDPSEYIRSRYVYYLMFIPGYDWRTLANEQKNSNDSLVREAAEAAIRVGTMREARKRVRLGR